MHFSWKNAQYKTSFLKMDIRPPLDQQSCGRPLPTSKMHVWTLELTQGLLGAPDDIIYIYVTIQIFSRH